jgi:hypothetical protein
MCELYVSRGMLLEHASAAISALARYPDVFVDLMMVQELGLSVPDSQPLRVCAATAAGFMLWGVMTAYALATFTLHSPWSLNYLAQALPHQITLLLQGGSTSESWLSAGYAVLNESGPVLLAIFIFIVSTASHSVVRRILLPSQTQWWGHGALPMSMLAAAVIAAAALKVGSFESM